MPDITPFDIYLRKWNARPAGEPLSTQGGHLLPVWLDGLPDGRAGMIKIPLRIEERIGGEVMRWWNGDGAARIHAFEEQTGTLLMERALGARNLLSMAMESEDDAATRVVCQTLSRLHADRPFQKPGTLMSLTSHFASLAPMARREGGLMAECALVANELLATQRDQVVLHGDAHHSNILDFGERGWLAIDPKCVTGERTYDYVNVLCNPDLTTCADPVRLERQVNRVVEAAGLNRQRLLQWVMAHAALSAAWFLEDGERNDADRELAVAHLAWRSMDQAASSARESRLV